jgi:hypothetical protein
VAVPKWSSQLLNRRQYYCGSLGSHFGNRHGQQRLGSRRLNPIFNGHAPIVEQLGFIRPEVLDLLKDGAVAIAPGELARNIVWGGATDRCLCGLHAHQ